MFLVSEVTLIQICSNHGIIHSPQAPPYYECISKFLFLCVFLFISEKIFYVALNHKYLFVPVQLCNYFWSIHDLVTIIFLLLAGRQNKTKVKLKQIYNCLSSSLLYQMWKAEVPCLFSVGLLFSLVIVNKWWCSLSPIISRKYVVWKWLSTDSF